MFSLFYKEAWHTPTHLYSDREGSDNQIKYAAGGNDSLIWVSSYKKERKRTFLITHQISRRSNTKLGAQE